MKVLVALLVLKVLVVAGLQGKLNKSAANSSSLQTSCQVYYRLDHSQHTPLDSEQTRTKPPCIVHSKCPSTPTLQHVFLNDKSPSWKTIFVTYE